MCLEFQQVILMCVVKDKSRSLRRLSSESVTSLSEQAAYYEFFTWGKTAVGSRAGRWEVTGHVTQKTRRSCISLGSNVDMLACS